MNLQRPLWPPLADIETALFGPPDSLLDRWIGADPALPPSLREALDADPQARALRNLPAAEPAPDWTDAGNAPPPELADRIRRTADARRTHRHTTLPAPGQIVSVETVIGPQGPLDWVLPRPLALLLAEPTETPAVWYGWLAAPETDYASDFDLVLSEDDGPVDPAAGMVQVWNPAYLYLPNAGRLLARLPSRRLAAVRALAREFLSARAPGRPAHPGTVYPRTLETGDTVLTGSPLGGDDDPRRRYRMLYHAAAEALREPARLALVATAPGSALNRLCEALMDAARRAGRLLEPAPDVAYAMGDTVPREAILALEQGLKLYLAPAPGGVLRLTLERLAGRWTLTRFEQGEPLETIHLDDQHPRDILIFSPARTNRLGIQGPDGLELELPLDWTGESVP